MVHLLTDTVIRTHRVRYDNTPCASWEILWEQFSLTKYTFYDSNSHDYNIRLLIHAYLLIITVLSEACEP